MDTQQPNERNIVASTPLEVFISYAHQDEPLLRELEKHLSVLKRQEVISTWHDRQIIAGSDWEQNIDMHLEQAEVILLLISADFLASDYCYGIEMRRAMERAQAKQACVVSILLRPVDWQGTPFARLQALPTNGKAITTWENRDEAFANVVTGLRRTIAETFRSEITISRVNVIAVRDEPSPHPSRGIPLPLSFIPQSPQVDSVEQEPKQRKTTTQQKHLLSRWGQKLGPRVIGVSFSVVLVLLIIMAILFSHFSPIKQSFGESQQPTTTRILLSPVGIFQEFLIPTEGSALTSITNGPDGNLWFVENRGNKIGRITPQGHITEFPVSAGSDLVGITSGPDGNLWFTEGDPNSIGRMTTSGVITGEFMIPTPNSHSETITDGPDGNVWFVEDTGNKLGRITPQGRITEFPIPVPLVPGQQNYHGLTKGPDSNLWFTEGLSYKVGRLIPPQGDITEFSVPFSENYLGSACAGPDGNLWFTDKANYIVRMTTSGVFTDFFRIPTLGSRPDAITAGPDKNIWFTEYSGNKIGQITTGL